MAVYVGLLRAVNVGGNILKMDRLRKLCADLEFVNTRTYLQSGNVVFESSLTAPSVAKALERKLAGETRLPVSVIIRKPSDLRKVINGNPFIQRPQSATETIDEKLVQHYVTFLAGSPAESSLQSLATIKTSDEQFHLSGKELYLFCPSGYAFSKFSNNAIEKALGVAATTRNWNTVTQLWTMVAGK